MRDIITKLEELNTEKAKLNEGLGDMAHEAEKDHEVQMARSDCYKSAKYAVSIHKMLKDVSEMEGIDGWVASKLTKAADYLGSVKHYMEGEMMSDVELAVVPVAGDMTDAMTMPEESVEVIEAEERDYICVHAKKGKYECSGTSSYAAAKKAAEHWGLKSTAGIDAHLADKEKTATESIEEADYNPELSMMANSRDKVENTYAAILQGVRGRGPAEETEVGDYIGSNMTKDEILKLIDMLEPQGYDKDFLLKDLAPLMKEDDSIQNAPVDGPVKTHDVKKGDTLYSLAKKHNTSVDRLKQMNRQDDDKIKVGQKLNVPEDADVIGDILKKLPNTKAGQKTGKDVIGDIISKLPKDDPSPQPSAAGAPDTEPKVSAQQQQKIANKAVAAPKTLPKAPPQRPERIRSFAQDTTAPLSIMKNWSKN